MWQILIFRPGVPQECELKSKSLLKASRLLIRFTGSSKILELFRSVAESLENHTFRLFESAHIIQTINIINHITFLTP